MHTTTTVVSGRNSAVALRPRAVVGIVQGGGFLTRELVPPPPPPSRNARHDQPQQPAVQGAGVQADALLWQARIYPGFLRDA